MSSQFKHLLGLFILSLVSGVLSYYISYSYLFKADIYQYPPVSSSATSPTQSVQTQNPPTTVSTATESSPTSTSQSIQSNLPAQTSTTNPPVSQTGVVEQTASSQALTPVQSPQTTLSSSPSSQNQAGNTPSTIAPQTGISSTTPQPVGQSSSVSVSTPTGSGSATAPLPNPLSSSSAGVLTENQQPSSASGALSVSPTPPPDTGSGTSTSVPSVAELPEKREILDAQPIEHIKQPIVPECLKQNLIEQQCFDVSFLGKNRSKFADKNCKGSSCFTFGVLKNRCLEISRNEQFIDMAFWQKYRSGKKCTHSSYLKKTFSKQCENIPEFSKIDYLTAVCRQIEIKGELPTITVEEIKRSPDLSPDPTTLPSTIPESILPQDLSESTGQLFTPHVNTNQLPQQIPSLTLPQPQKPNISDVSQNAVSVTTQTPKQENTSMQTPPNAPESSKIPLEKTEMNKQEKSIANLPETPSLSSSDTLGPKKPILPSQEPSVPVSSITMPDNQKSAASDEEELKKRKELEEKQKQSIAEYMKKKALLLKKTARNFAPIKPLDIRKIESPQAIVQKTEVIKNNFTKSLQNITPFMSGIGVRSQESEVKSLPAAQAGQQTGALPENKQINTQEKTAADQTVGNAQQDAMKTTTDADKATASVQHPTSQVSKSGESENNIPLAPPQPTPDTTKPTDNTVSEVSSASTESKDNAITKSDELKQETVESTSQLVQSWQENLDTVFKDATKEMEERAKSMQAKVDELAQKIENKMQELEELREKQDIILQDAREKIQEMAKIADEKEEKREEILQREEIVREIDVPEKIQDKVDEHLVELAEKLQPEDQTNIDVVINFDTMNAAQRGILEKLSTNMNIDSNAQIASITFTPEQFSNFIAVAPLVVKDEKSLIQEDHDTRLSIDTSTVYIGSQLVHDDLGYDGTGIVVAVLDTGVASDHPALKDAIIEHADFTGEGIGDLNGHGTHVASIIAGRDALYNGNAPGAQILDGKVMKADGSGKMSYAISALKWAMEKGAHIVNISLGSRLDDCDGSDALSLAVKDAISKGVIVITAAGNFGPDNNTVSAPGCALEPITVGAIDESGAVANFSSRGPTSSGLSKPDIFAPGVAITSAWYDGTFAVVNGTSQAAPHVAGITALLLQANPKLAPDEVKKILISTSDTISKGNPGDENIGIINAYKAIYLYAGLEKTEEAIQKEVKKEEAIDGEMEETDNKVKSTPQEDEKNLSLEDIEIRIVEKASQDMREAREAMKTCILDAQGDIDAKSLCSSNYLKTQIRLQKKKLSQSEAEQSTALEKIALDLNNLLPDIDQKYQDDVRKIASSIYYTVFSGTSLNSVLKEGEKLAKVLSSKESSNIKEGMQDFIQTYIRERSKAVEDKFDKKLIPFKDVDDTVWYFSYVEDVKNKGIISGYKDASGKLMGNFGAENNLTVAEALKIVLEAADIGSSSSTDEPKNKNAINHWAKGYYLNAEELNLDIVKASTDNPNRNITREEVVQLMIQLLDIPELPSFDKIFDDVELDVDSSTHIYTAYYLGMVSGDSNKNTFRPKDPILRAEMAKILVEALELVE